MKKVSLLTSGLEYSKLFENEVRTQNEGLIRLVEPAVEIDDLETSKEDNENPFSIKWNKRSPLSARNVILSALNEFDHIDDAILIYQPGNSNKTFHESTSSIYDLQIDRWIKGYGYLLKELIQLYIKQNNGRIFFCLDTCGHSVMSPVESSIFNFLKTLVTNISILYQNEPFKVFCFEADTTKREDFLVFFNKTINDSKYVAGKVYRFADKKSLFSFSRN